MGSSSNESNSLIVCNMKYLAILAILFSPSWPPSPKPRLMPKPLPPTTVDTMAVDTDTADTVVLTDTVVTITARGLLMPNPPLMPKPKLESHTTALLMVPILMVSVPTVPLKSTNDLLMPSPKQRLMPMLPPHTTVDTT